MLRIQQKNMQLYISCIHVENITDKHTIITCIHVENTIDKQNHYILHLR